MYIVFAVGLFLVVASCYFCNDNVITVRGVRMIKSSENENTKSELEPTRSGVIDLGSGEDWAQVEKRKFKFGKKVDINERFPFCSPQSFS